MKVIDEHIERIKQELNRKGGLITLEKLKEILPNEIEKELITEADCKELNKETQKSYLERLGKGLKSSNNFYKQFNRGSGSELTEKIYFNKKYNKWIRNPAKFFNIRSSSRLAFELFSWMINEENVQDLQFEFKLPKLKGGNNPNMDVYILHNNNTITFIESKFTETKNNKPTDIPDAYYKEKGDAYRITKNSNGERVLLESTLSERYSNEKLKDLFVDFIIDLVNKQYDAKADQYDVKQEVAHLLGIAFLMIDIDSSKQKNGQIFKKNGQIFINLNNAEIAIKKIQFYNIVYDFGIQQSQLSKEIIASANILFDKIKQAYNIDVEFEYEFKFIQDIIKENKDKFMSAKAYESDDSVSDMLIQFGINVEEL